MSVDGITKAIMHTFGGCVFKRVRATIFLALKSSEDTADSSLLALKNPNGGHEESSQRLFHGKLTDPGRLCL